jgi:hypothetical protein
MKECQTQIYNITVWTVREQEGIILYSCNLTKAFKAYLHEIPAAQMDVRYQPKQAKIVNEIHENDGMLFKLISTLFVL